MERWLSDNLRRLWNEEAYGEGVAMRCFFLWSYWSLRWRLGEGDSWGPFGLFDYMTTTTIHGLSALAATNWGDGVAHIPEPQRFYLWRLLTIGPLNLQWKQRELPTDPRIR